VGKDGKIFKIIKFRSMVPDAEKFSGPAKAKEHDPRITNIGKILRTTAMDELPQLWNIFKGEMSFVGPRAERPEFVAQFSKNIPKYNLRHTVTPGLTGLAQILGSAYSEPEEKLKYDIWYIKNQGFFLDVHLIFLSFLITFMAKWTTKKSKYELLPGKLIKKIKNQVK
jgi:lipopolysaccharide/colanic/teichoic acid biosynthesis glycosyltransferase